MQLDTLSVEDIYRGYHYNSDTSAWCCNLCDATFAEGEVFPIDGHYFEARRAVELHLGISHPARITELIHDTSRYNNLTDNQKLLLELMAEGHSDKTIAKMTDVSPSTIRHQKFMFREKAKQATLYLAIYQSVFDRKAREELVPVPENIRAVDERFVVTNEEREHILKTSFSSLTPLKLRQFSPKEKKKTVILATIAEEFEPNQRYTENEVNSVLGNIYEDHVTLRRYLVEYGYMERTRDGSQYWRSR